MKSLIAGHGGMNVKIRQNRYPHVHLYHQAQGIQAVRFQVLFQFRAVPVAQQPGLALQQEIFLQADDSLLMQIPAFELAFFGKCMPGMHYDTHPLTK